MHERFMRLALGEAAAALEAGDFPVGCVLVHQGRVVARGHRTNSRAGQTNELDHAEVVALRRLFADQPGIDMNEVTLYSTMEPCLMCYATLLLNGIRRVVYAYEDVMGGGSDLELSRLRPLYREMEVEVVPRVLRAESLALFQKFFADPATGYWQDSELARYTLAQNGGAKKPAAG